MLQLQALMLDSEGAEANDLPPGDSGIAGRGARSKKADRGHATKNKSAAKFASTEATSGVLLRNSS